MIDIVLGLVVAFGFSNLILLCFIYCEILNSYVPRFIDFEICSRTRSLSREVSKLRRVVKKNEKE